MIIVLATCGNGYCGCDAEEAFFYEEGTADNEINTDVYNWACDNAESFSHCHFGWCEEYTDEEWDDYIENYVTFEWHIATYDEYVKYCDNWGIEPRVI